MTQFGPVFPILPCFEMSGEFNPTETAKYVAYLEAQGATSVMTTAGTSQFNLLSVPEILELNNCVSQAFSRRTILGAPALAEIHLAQFLAQSHEAHPRAELLLSYPERFYSTEDIAAFFERISRVVPKARLHIHGLPLRGTRGGVQDYDATILAAIREATDSVVGMKEESSSYEAGFELCASTTNTQTFEFIVAGGSMRRFLLLHAAGAQSFFAGLGSLLPSVELSFFEHISAGRLRESHLIVSECETPVFRVFMDIGWHKSLRYAAKRLQLLHTEERLPMTQPTPEEAQKLDSALTQLERSVETLKRDGVLS